MNLNTTLLVIILTSLTTLPAQSYNNCQCQDILNSCQFSQALYYEEYAEYHYRSHSNAFAFTFAASPPLASYDAPSLWSYAQFLEADLADQILHDAQVIAEDNEDCVFVTYLYNSHVYTSAKKQC